MYIIKFIINVYELFSRRKESQVEKDIFNIYLFHYYNKIYSRKRQMKSNTYISKPNAMLGACFIKHTPSFYFTPKTFTNMILQIYRKLLTFDMTHTSYIINKFILILPLTFIIYLYPRITYATK